MITKNKILIYATGILLISSSIITYSFNIGHNMTSKYTPLNSNSKSIFLPLKNKDLEIKILDVLESLDEFSRITTIRHTNKELPRSEYDKKYDKLFAHFIDEANNVESELRFIISNELKAYRYTYYIALLINILIIIVASIIFYRYEKDKLKTVAILQKSNDDLEATKKDLIKTNKIIKHLANTDKLTQLHNRLKIDSIIDFEVQRARRYNKIFSVILLDVDYFKKINDTYGHDVGDYVLIEISNLLKKNIRVTDYVGRFGGEEFIIICPETNSENTALLAEKLRISMQEYKFKGMDKKTCSFGVSEFILGDSTKEDVIKRSDKALYKAKNNGRNQVAVM